MSLSAAFAAPGDRDYGFGTLGTVTTDFVDAGDVGSAMKVLGDGKILVAGRTNIGGVNHFGVVRYHQDGTLDTNFGVAGKVTLLIGTECEAYGIEVQPSDGKFLVAGTAKISNKWVFAVARFYANGDLDTDFSVDGIVTVAPVTRYTSNNYCRALAIQPDGKIILGGYSTTVRYGSVPYGINACAVCLRDDGTFDTEFGTGGVSKVPYSGPIGGVASILLQQDEDGNPLVVLGGSEGTGGGASPNFSIQRHLSDGTLDPSFGTNGKVVIDFFGQQDSIASLTQQPDGKILAVGTTWTGTENRVAVLRLHPDGSVDSGLGNNGKVTVLYPGGNFFGSDMVVQQDGRILVSGYITPESGNREIAVVRLHHDGSVDSEFGSHGITTVAVSGSTDDGAAAIAIQAYNGPTFSYRVLAAGRSVINGQADYCVVALERGELGDPPPAVNYPFLVGVTAGGATFAVPVDPNGSHTTVTLEYGPLGESPSQIPLTLFPSDGDQFQLVEHRLTELVPDTEYAVRLVAESDVGRVFSADTQFRTLKRPVVFVPGIAGSQLKYRLGGNGAWGGLWPSLDPLSIAQLHLNGGRPDIKAVDVVRFYFGDVYGNFIDKWTSDLGYTEYLLEDQPERLTSNHMLDLPFDGRPTFFVFPYDWRLSNQDHGPTLHTYLSNISQLHDGVKVNIIAHSMGGLLVRRYLLIFGAENVQRIATVGSPFWGAPKVVYVMLSGNFFPFGFLDFINHNSMRRLAVNSPGLHQLLPSSLLEQHMPNHPNWPNNSFLFEDRLDFNFNRVIEDGEDGRPSYTLSQVLTSIDHWTEQWRGNSPFALPSIESQLFHSEFGGAQDDWSADTLGVEFLHIAGQQDQDETPSCAVVSPRVVGHGGLQLEDHRIAKFSIKETYGDGTVPVVSAIRLPEHLVPNTLVRVVTGPNKTLNHNTLMKNDLVTQMTTAFFEHRPVPFGPTPPPAAPPLANESETITVTHQEIFILGAGYVAITDGEGNTNALLSEIAAQRVPGVEAEYGGEDLWCRLEVEPEVALTLSGASPSEVVEILVSQIGSDGSTLSTRRFLIEPDEMQWQFTLPAVDMANPTEPEMIVDTNGDDTFDPGEAVMPTHSADGADVDVTPPQLTLSLAASGPGIVSTLSPQDNAAGVKAFYTFNSGPVTEYTAPLDFPEGTEGIVRAFAEDAMGNRSGLITTTVRPNVQVRNSGPGTISLDWPVAEGYVLMEADNPAGPWTRSDADISQETFTESAEIVVSPNSQKFYRLVAQPVAR